jgi:hypothetical protein
MMDYYEVITTILIRQYPTQGSLLWVTSQVIWSKESFYRAFAFSPSQVVGGNTV